MTIKVKFFASLRELINIDEITLDNSANQSITDIWNHVTSNLAIPNNTLCAINLEQSTFETRVKDNDEVAFFPPVTGG